jgi:hypothetical protein
MTPQDQLDRVLDSLLHDLRSPLGAASGYLRLLREGRIPQGAETERALQAAQNAVQAMARLCADAERWLEDSAHADAAPVQVAHLAQQISRELEQRQITLAGADLVSDGAVSVRGGVDLVCGAVCDVLSTVARTRSETHSPFVQCAEGELRFGAHKTRTPGSQSANTFDPWSYPGLTVALACRRIISAGGRCDPLPDSAGVQIVFTAWT